MNIKSLVLGLAVAASLGSTAKATELVMNGDLKSGDTAVHVYVNTYDGAITSWKVQGAPSNLGTYNAVLIYDVLGGSLPAFMPPSYYSCTAALGFVSGNSCMNPDGEGDFINLDGDPAFPAAISQAIPIGGPNGLVLGQQYRLTFDWAAVERDDQNGPTTDNYLEVTLGSSLAKITTMTDLPSKGFSGWYTTSYDFTWDGLGSTLTFLAHGNPHGLPPSIDLDSISLTTVPEPSTLALFFAAGFGLMGVAARRRRQTVVAD